MKKINTIVNLSKEDLDKLKDSYIQAVKDKNFYEYLKMFDIEENLAIKYTTRLNDSYCEFKNCSNCNSIHECKNAQRGYHLTPEKSKNSIVYSYNECHYMKEELNQTAYLDNISLFNIPKNLKNASLKDIYKDDPNRKEIIKYIVEFIKNYEQNKEQKGLYLHGSFGSGKSYLIATLFNELAKKNIKSSMVYFPEFLRALKESFDTDYKEIYNHVKTAPLLLLDDIGAENLSNWSRDEILGSILQYRMDENMPTFFTSNYSLEELENHLSSVSGNIDRVKARRIIERIKYLTNDLKLISMNRRK